MLACLLLYCDFFIFLNEKLTMFVIFAKNVDCRDLTCRVAGAFLIYQSAAYHFLFFEWQISYKLILFRSKVGWIYDGGLKLLQQPQ